MVQNIPLVNSLKTGDWIFNLAKAMRLALKVLHLLYSTLFAIIFRFLTKRAHGGKIERVNFTHPKSSPKPNNFGNVLTVFRQ